MWDDDSVGDWHETYLARAGEYEAAQGSDTSCHGLARAGERAGKEEEEEEDEEEEVVPTAGGTASSLRCMGPRRRG